LIDPLAIMEGRVKNNNILPGNTRYTNKTHRKVQDSNNKAYVDCICTFLLSKLVNNNKCPGFPIFYSHLTGVIDKLRIDITDDFYSIRNEAWFHRNLNKLFTIETYYDNESQCSGTSRRPIEIDAEAFGFNEETAIIAEDDDIERVSD